MKKLNLYKILNLRGLALLLSLLFSLQIFAQNKPTFTVFANAKEVPMTGYFDLSFTLKNANGTQFTPPNFKNFTILSGPNSSTSMQIINGQVSREMSWNYTLQPKKLGILRIEAATVKANGTVIKTPSTSVRAIAGKPQTGDPINDEEGVTVKMLTDKTEAYLGEQVLLDLKLFTTVAIDGYDFGEDPDYRGFFAHELKRFLSRTQREVVNGQQVTTKVLRRVALFPQQTGELTIPAARAQLAVVNERDRIGSFFSRNVKPVFVVTDSIKINVLPLPPNAPETFTGAVGNYQMRASATRRQATTDDAVSISMLIEGDGDLKRVLPPPLLLSDSFEVYPPKVLEETSSENGGLLRGKKIIEYLVLPKYPGQYEISPAFTYFDSEIGEYQTVTAGPFPLTVTPGSGRTTSSSSRTDDNLKEEDIRFIKTETSLEKKGNAFVGSPLFYGLMGLPVLTFLGLFFCKKIKERKSNVDHGELKIRLANKEALKRLATAKSHLTAGDSRQFYDEVSKASLGYVGDKLSIPLSELSKENVRGKLQSLSVSEPLVEDFVKVIQTCEMALFAGMDNSSDMQKTYEKAMAAISGIEGEVRGMNAEAQRR